MRSMSCASMAFRCGSVGKFYASMLQFVTRPQTFSLPLSAQAVATDIQTFTTQFHVADESAAVTAQLVQLIQLVAVGGKQIHDANIVATMLVHGVSQLLTHNVDDFARYSSFITVQPLIPVV